MEDKVLLSITLRRDGPDNPAVLKFSVSGAIAGEFIKKLSHPAQFTFVEISDCAAIAIDSILYARILPLPAEWVDIELPPDT